MTDAAPASVGFIGTGRTGAPMAERLLDGSWDLSVFNRTAGKADGVVLTSSCVNGAEE